MRGYFWGTLAVAVATFAHREARFAIQPVALLALSQYRAPPAARLR